MKRLMLVGLIVGILISHAQPVHAQDSAHHLAAAGNMITAQIPGCELVGFYQDKELYICDPTPTPTATTTPSATPVAPSPTTTSTAVPPTASPSATSTPVAPTPTSTPTNVRPIPPNSLIDGRITITQAGVYSGSAVCGAITGGDYCLNINASPVTLQDFTVTALSSYGAILTTSNATFLRGTINGRGGITGYRVQNVLIDTVTFNVSVGAIGIYDQHENCEALTTKRTRFITIQNSVINNTSQASETAWWKCSQDVKILNNRFKTTSEWSLSFPDALDVEIRGNTFDLSPEPRNWLAIELPRTFRVRIEDNTFAGPSGDWGVWLNSGSADVTYVGNTVAGGVGLVCCITAPGTGDAGLR
jgi:hypothetical protein